MAYTFTVNQKSFTVDADAEAPLLWVLRDELGYTGPKFGCGIGMCGACTVHLDGSAVRSCSVPVSAAQGKSIITIEGLSANGNHPVQQAWQELDVAQCGYCQAGQMMAAAALLTQTPHPTDSQIEDVMTDNLCRCGTYTRIRQAVRRAAEIAAGSAELRQSSSTTKLG